ncbi:MAG: MoaD family protein [Candidatus Bathyarchaeota archaeon]|nr:MoaD family protein [Candidatus Bathyarchaeota archaeon]
MGSVKVKLYAHLRQVAGIHEVAVEIGEQSTIKDVLEMTLKSFGPNFEKNLKNTSTGEFAPFLIMIRRKEISSIKGDFNTEVIDGDEISLLDPTGGG